MSTDPVPSPPSAPFKPGLVARAIAAFSGTPGLAIKIAIVGALIYLVIRIFSPDTARRLREKWSGKGY